MSPDAHADPGLDQNHYIADLADAGIPMGTPAQEVYVGQLVCQNLAAGMTTTAAAQRLLSVPGITTDAAVVIVGLAVLDMCPQFAPVPITHTPLATGASAHAYPGDPPGANCQTVPLGALYCDGPVQPNGGWTRCVETPIFECYHRDPTAPPVKIGEPDHHIGDGL